jgi:hypothetical protein
MMDNDILSPICAIILYQDKDYRGGYSMETQEKKKYIAPEIIFETELEVKAGSWINSGSDEGIELFPGDGE